MHPARTCASILVATLVSVLPASCDPAPASATAGAAASGTGYVLIGWNNLGMHCMDADFSVFSILPPYNTIHAQLVRNGRLVADPAGLTVTYEAVTDPGGSINTTSDGKTNFWSYVALLFGVTLGVDEGLGGHPMPGPGNVPRAMAFDASMDGWIAEGIPITPRDDAGAANRYPMFRLVARDAGSGAVLATTDIVLPVSDEMDCRACHASGAGAAARPAGGWVNDPDPQRDYRRNILRLHDDREGGTAAFAQALSAAGYDPGGLAPTATGGQPVLCAGCHPSNALGTGQAAVRPLTRAVHSRHAGVLDPYRGGTLDAASNRTACYLCHPGSATRCLRGVMGRSVAPDGALSMQCQSCHGDMSLVGRTARQGWLEEPVCQSCHTGTAVANAGLIRYTGAFTAAGQPRAAVDPTFATNADAPAPGLSLYRFSRGHGGLACEACHGSTHAEFPSADRNDNVQSLSLQQHVGPLAECTACHATSPVTRNGGPHGMHPVGQAWVSAHHEEEGAAGAGTCQPCHGDDLRGTVLSQSQADRTLTAFGTKRFWRGFQIGCWSCHKGPDSERANGNRPAQATSAAVMRNGAQPVVATLRVSDPDGDPLRLRIVSQPAHGTVALSGQTATYLPDGDSSTQESFTFAAWDGSTDSNLGTITIGATAGPAPTVTSVTRQSSPFRMTVNGAGFEAGLTAAIAGAPWPQVSVPGAGKVYLRGGDALKALFPLDAWVPIVLTNPSGGWVAIEYNRGAKAWRSAANAR